MANKKSCNKGYGCGGSCISIKYACRKEFPEGISVSIDKSREVIKSQVDTSSSPKEKAIPEGRAREVSYKGAKQQRDDFDRNPKKYARELRKLFPDAEVEVSSDEFYSMLDIKTKIKDGQGNTHEVEFRAKTDNTSLYINDKNPIDISFKVNGGYDNSGIPNRCFEHRKNSQG